MVLQIVPCQITGGDLFHHFSFMYKSITGGKGIQFMQHMTGYQDGKPAFIHFQD